MVPKALENLEIFEKNILKILEYVKRVKIDQKQQKNEFFHSKFEFLVIFGPFIPIA